MRVENAEKGLLEDLKAMSENQPSQRCLFLRCSHIEEEREAWLPIILKVLREEFYDGLEGLYVCHDNDIFILGRFWTYKKLDEFLTHLTPKLPPAPSQELARLFEVGVHWSQLRTLCEKKIENLELLQQASLQEDAQAAELEMVSREETFNTIDPDLISSLPMRREHRNSIEIMVVEDDVFSQKLIQNTIGKRYPLSITADGQGAVLSYVHKAPDILFLDIGLPDIDGHEVLEKLFELDPQAYVVMFSGNGDRENVLKAIELGAKGFVGKPFTKDKIFQYIQKSPFIQAKEKGANHHGHSTH